MSKTTHTNAATGRTLKAENIAALDQAMQSRRFTEPKWATFQQWKGTGRTVAPGEKGVELEGSSGFKWRVFNISQTVTGEAEAARAPAPIAARPTAPQSTARKAKPAPRAGVKKVIPKGARGAPAATKATGLPAGWQRHPVTGHPMRPPAGVQLADAIPFGHDPKALDMVRREHAKHGRIGAANTLVMLELAGLQSDATNYRKGLSERRRGEGRYVRNRHAVYTESVALAKQLAAPEAEEAQQPAAPAPVAVAIEEPAPAPAPAPAPEPMPTQVAQPEGKPLSFRERWLAKFGHRFQ